MKDYIKKVIRTCVLSVLMVVTLFANNVVVSADALPGLGDIVDGSKLINESVSEKIEKNLTRGNILDQGVARITDKGNGVVNIHGGMTCYVVCDKLTLKVTLQQLKNGSWRNYRGPYTSNAYSSSLHSKSYNETVAKGYYYRVKVACTAEKGDTIESKAPTTDGLWID